MAISVLSTRRCGERGAVSSLVAVAILVGAVVVTATHVTVNSLQMQKETELNVAFSLSTPRAIRAATLDSSGTPTLLESIRVSRSLQSHLKLFSSNIEGQRSALDKRMCAAVVDVGTNTMLLNPQYVVGPLKSDGSECTVYYGPLYAAVLSQAQTDYNNFGSVDRFYVVIYDETAPEQFNRIARVDFAPQVLPVSTVSWSAPGSTTGPE